MSYTQEKRDAARRAAQAALDTVASWDYSFGYTKIESKLREALEEAGATTDNAAIARIVTKTDALTADENAGTMLVREVWPR